jgi:hypothetical protein
VCRERWVDADHLGVGFAVGYAGIAIKAVAADTRRVRQGFAVSLFEQNADRQMKRLVSFALEVVEKLLDARFMRDGLISIRFRPGRFGRIFAALTTDAIEFLGGLIIRFEDIILQWPGWRNAVHMPDLFEIALTQAKQHSSINFAVAADVIVKPRMESLPLGIVPGFRGLVVGVNENGLAIPIFAFAREIVAAFQQQDFLACLRQPPSHGSTTGAGTNDNDVIMLRAHAARLSSACIAE